MLAAYLTPGRRIGERLLGKCSVTGGVRPLGLLLVGPGLVPLWLGWLLKSLWHLCGVVKADPFNKVAQVGHGHVRMCCGVGVAC